MDAQEFERKAEDLKRKTQALLWDGAANFFKVRLAESEPPSDARELLGYLPWRFGLPDKGKEVAWAQAADGKGFRAPHGLTTAERRHPRFRSHGCCKCERLVRARASLNLRLQSLEKLVYLVLLSLVR